MKYTSRSPEEAVIWQEEVRAQFFKLLKLDDLISLETQIPFRPKILSDEETEHYSIQEIEINMTLNRRINCVITMPIKTGGPFPAIVCVHGHGGNRHIVYEVNSPYNGFAKRLAERGYVTISTNVGQHEVYEENRTLMGERLWDVMRCVDYLESLSAVDKSRIGCAGLSLGGEMAMWLGGMDQRISANMSSGFLTIMDQLEQNHCMCWKFEGLRELVDFADIYSLTAPRPLQCQNGLKEPESQFYVPIAREAMKEVKVIYDDFGASDKVALLVHEGGHVVNIPGLLAFFKQHFENMD